MPDSMGPMPAGLTPGANFGGNQLALPSSSYSQSTAAIGGNQNPFLSAFPSGQNFPAYNSPYAASGATADVAGLNVGAGINTSDFAKGLRWLNYPRQSADALSQFLAGGAGFSPEVANALIAAMQPQIASGQANIMEQFGSMGLRGSSPAALGLAGYNAQTNLGVGEIFSNMYEQAVSNFLSVIMGAGKHPQGGGFLGGLGAVLGGLTGGSALGNFIGGASSESSGGGGYQAPQYSPSYSSVDSSGTVTSGFPGFNVNSNSGVGMGVYDAMLNI